MVIIRCDSSFQIGTGHVYRDLSLAHQLKKLGHTVVFFCRRLPGNIMHMITEQSFPVHMIEPECTQTEEIKSLLQMNPDWVVIDHYEIYSDYESALREKCKVFVIDDTMTREHQCDVLLDQNFRTEYESAYVNLVPKFCRRLLGPQHSLLPQTLDRSSWKRTFSNKPKNVLVFFGGADPTGEILKFYEALLDQKIKSCYHLVATASHQFYQKLLPLKNTEKIEWHLSPKNWHELIRNCDYYFGSTGTVTWERFYFGLPGSVVCIADNQIQIAEELEKAGYLKYFGLSENIDYNLIIPEIDQFANDTEKNKMISMGLQDLVNRVSLDLLSDIFKK